VGQAQSSQAEGDDCERAGFRDLGDDVRRSQRLPTLESGQREGVEASGIHVVPVLPGVPAKNSCIELSSSVPFVLLSPKNEIGLTQSWMKPGPLSRSAHRLKVSEVLLDIPVSM